MRGVSLAHQVQEILKERIKVGEFSPGSQIPPENELAAQFKVSRATIRMAISALVERGWLVRRHGVGTFVSRLANISNPLHEAEDFNYLIARNGYQPGVQYLKVWETEPEEGLIAILGLNPGDAILRAHKVFTADGEPVVYCINSMPTKLLGRELTREAIARPQIIEPLFDFLEERCDQHIDYHVAKVRAERPPIAEFPDPALDPDVPVLLIEEVGYNASQDPLWHSLAYFPGDHMTFELVRHRVRR